MMESLSPIQEILVRCTQLGATSFRFMTDCALMVEKDGEMHKIDHDDSVWDHPCIEGVAYLLVGESDYKAWENSLDPLEKHVTIDPQGLAFPFLIHAIRGTQDGKTVAEVAVFAPGHPAYVQHMNRAGGTVAASPDLQ